ncbi:hypothetical protein ACI77I_26365 [Pseudomonas sp. D47]|uniref:hypothetical protein n=1 Tax=Pseudomonas sp. D47 TaxID=3159447 RepID=UPI00387AEA0C
MNWIYLTWIFLSAKDGYLAQMKKISQKAKLRFLRKWISIEKRLYKSRVLRETGKTTPKTSFIAPSYFSLNGPERKKLVSFIKDIRDSIVSGSRAIFIDFRQTQKFIADGTLLFYAEMDRLLDHHPTLTIRCMQPFNKKASQVLQQIGFYKRIGKTVKESVCDHDDVISWRVARGQGAVGEQYDKILGHYDGIITEALQSELYTGLTEAMTNAHHHAYISQRGDGIRSSPSYKPWWMFSQEKAGMLTVVFCDLGVGIPGSLPHSSDEGWKRWWAVMRRLGMHTRGDANVIRGAIRHSRTRTQLHNRGKGLIQIVETIGAVDDGQAILQSNRGWYRIHARKETIDDYKLSIMGTIIFWQMPLEARP